MRAFHFQIADKTKDAFLTGASFAEHKDERFRHNLDAQMWQGYSAYLQLTVGEVTNWMFFRQ